MRGRKRRTAGFFVTLVGFCDNPETRAVSAPVLQVQAFREGGRFKGHGFRPGVALLWRRHWSRRSKLKRELIAPTCNSFSHSLPQP
jgi:hypothetical protein